MKYNTLAESIREMYTKIMNDDLITTLKKDPISAEYLETRVKELFEEIIFSEREVIIEKLAS